MLLAVAPHERGQNRLYNVASLRCALHPGRSENLDGLMPTIGSMHGRMELVHQIRGWFSGAVAELAEFWYLQPRSASRVTGY